MVAAVAGDPAKRTSFLIPAATLLERCRVAPAAAGTQPVPGLRSFREQDADLFHGRDPLADAIAAKVRSQRVVALVGRSGRASRR